MSSVEKKNPVKKKIAKKVPSKKAPVRKTIKKTAVRKPTTKKAITGGADRKGKDAVNENNMVLSAVLMINDARNMHSSLTSLLDKYDEVTIDASSVEMIDTAVMQLFLAFSMKMKSQEKNLIWMNPSQVFVSRAGALDISEEMGFMEMGDE